MAAAAWREVLHMMSDDVVLGIVLPLVVYWLYAGMYHMMMMMMPPALEPFRLHSVQEEEQRNLVTLPQVVKGVLLQQSIQALVALLLFVGSSSSLDCHFSPFSYSFQDFLCACFFFSFPGVLV
jgi:sphinganine C4-monooxygenase